MSIAGFRSNNHPQQTAKRGAKDAVDDRGTDPAFIAALEKRFGRFTLDVAAAPHNTKCERFYREGLPELIVMLLPANRVEQRWWQDLVEPFRDKPGSQLRVEFLPGRMRFHRPDWVPGPKGDRPPFGCCLLIWDARLSTDPLDIGTVRVKA